MFSFKPFFIFSLSLTPIPVPYLGFTLQPRTETLVSLNTPSRTGNLSIPSLTVFCTQGNDLVVTPLIEQGAQIWTPRGKFIGGYGYYYYYIYLPFCIPPCSVFMTSKPFFFQKSSHHPYVLCSLTGFHGTILIITETIPLQSLVHLESTPLHFVAANGHSNAVRTWLLHGAHADRTDKYGVNPEMLTRENGEYGGGVEGVVGTPTTNSPFVIYASSHDTIRACLITSATSWSVYPSSTSPSGIAGHLSGVA